MERLSRVRGGLGVLDTERDAVMTANTFAAFKTTHNKQYADDSTDHRRRKAVFTQNARYIAAHNRNKQRTFTLAVNHLADLEDTELAAMRGSISTQRAHPGTSLVTPPKTRGYDTTLLELVSVGGGGLICTVGRLTPIRAITPSLNSVLFWLSRGMMMVGAHFLYISSALHCC
jgi:hypothetical protein